MYKADLTALLLIFNQLLLHIEILGLYYVVPCVHIYLELVAWRGRPLHAEEEMGG